MRFESLWGAAHGGDGVDGKGDVAKLHHGQRQQQRRRAAHIVRGCGEEAVAVIGLRHRDEPPAERSMLMHCV